MSSQESKVIVALDFNSAEKAMQFVESVSPEACRVKIGKELFTHAGPELVKRIVSIGFDVFLDLKFHDIPNTVNKAVTAACDLGVWMLNVHALGGRTMMQAASQAVKDHPHKAKLIAVSILTSTSQQEMEEIGIHKPVQKEVTDLTGMALECGLDGMVCSAQEVAYLREQFGVSPLFITPGIRPAGSDDNDQQRIMTPEKAILAGSSYLVIGRPVTQHADPLLELSRINDSLSNL